MKKKFLLFTAGILISTFMFQSCIGSFALTNKVLTWNKNVNNKFVNELVFFAFWVLPVYEVSALADLLVINSIEFWSGNNPMEAHNKVIATEHGNYYLTAQEGGYKVDSPDGNTINFIFDENSKIWSLRVNEGEKTEFLKLKDAGHVEIINAKGEFVDVELTRNGVDKYAASVGMPIMANY